MNRLLGLIIGLTLATAYTANAQVVVTQGPVTTLNKFAWEQPSNVPLADSPSFDYRVKDLSVANSPVVTLSNVQCSGTTVVTCTAPMPQAAADMINKVGSHGVALALFRSDLGESSYSLPFGLPTPAGVPTQLKIIK